MSKKNEKEQRRKKKLREREPAKKPRTAIIHEGGERTVIRQGNTKGYDVEMIRDFLDHLLLELRVQHYEHQKLLKTLGATDDLGATTRAMETISEPLAQQFVKFQTKYQTALTVSNSVDAANASDAEAKGVTTFVVESLMAKRDEQIGHLEALKELFEESLQCAKIPFGVDRYGNPIQPRRVFNVREMSDKAFVASLPTYEELLPLFGSHDFASEEGVRFLKNHDRKVPIVATGGDENVSVALYGADIVERLKKAGQDSTPAVTVTVSSYSELQFVIAAIAKFVGVPSTSAECWHHL